MCFPRSTCVTAGLGSSPERDWFAAFFKTLVSSLSALSWLNTASSQATLCTSFWTLLRGANSMYRCAQCVTTHTEQHDHISSREHAWLKIAHLCVPKQLSSTCHVSFFAASDTDHKHKFSLTYLSSLSDDLTSSHKAFGARSIFTLRSSTAEWRINTNPVSHRL